MNIQSVKTKLIIVKKIITASTLLGVFGASSHYYSKLVTGLEESIVQYSTASYDYTVDRFASLNGYEKKPSSLTPDEIQKTIIADAHSLLVDPYLALAVAHVESRFNPSIKSKKGAIGIMQVMPEHLKFCNLKSKEELEDPFKNIRCGLKILAANLTQAGTVPNGLRIYNAGKVVNYPETEQYVKDVLSTRTAFLQKKSGKEKV